MERCIQCCFKLFYVCALTYLEERGYLDIKWRPVLIHFIADVALVLLIPIKDLIFLISTLEPVLFVTFRDFYLVGPTLIQNGKF